MKDEEFAEKIELQNFIKSSIDNAAVKYSSHLLSETALATENVIEEKPTYAAKQNLVDARVIMRDNFDAILAKHPEVLIFGEDAGHIGDVNQGFL